MRISQPILSLFVLAALSSQTRADGPENVFVAHPFTASCTIPSLGVQTKTPMQIQSVDNLMFFGTVNLDSFPVKTPGSLYEPAYFLDKKGAKKGLVSIQVLNYRESSMGPYSEIIFAQILLEKDPHSPAQHVVTDATSYFKSIADKAIYYSYQLYLNQTLPLEAGILVGFTKEMGDVTTDIAGVHKSYTVTLPGTHEQVATASTTFVEGLSQSADASVFKILVANKLFPEGNLGTVYAEGKLYFKPYISLLDHLQLGDKNIFSAQVTHAGFQPFLVGFGDALKEVSDFFSGKSLPEYCSPIKSQ